MRRLIFCSYLILACVGIGQALLTGDAVAHSRSLRVGQNPVPNCDDENDLCCSFGYFDDCREAEDWDCAVPGPGGLICNEGEKVEDECTDASCNLVLTNPTPGMVCKRQTKEKTFYKCVASGMDIACPDEPTKRKCHYNYDEDDDKEICYCQNGGSACEDQPDDKCY